MTSASQHSKGWAGIAFCVLLVVSVVMLGNAPGPNDSAAAINAFLHSAQRSLLWSAWLGLPIGAFFLWFALGLAAWLRAAAPDDEGLPAYLRTGAIALVTVAWVQTAVMVALAARPPADPGFVWYLNVALFGTVGAMPFTVFLYAAAHSMRRHRSAPAWIAWLGYIAAFGQVWTSFGMFYRTGIASDNLVVYAVISGLLPVLFILAASLCMLGVLGGRRAAGTV